MVALQHPNIDHHGPQREAMERRPTRASQTHGARDRGTGWGIQETCNRAVQASSPHRGAPRRVTTDPLGLKQVVKSFRYLLTDPRQFDILQSGPGWRGSNAIRSIATSGVPLAA